LNNYNNNNVIIIIIIIIIILIQFFIYLRAQLNSEWPVTESARIQTTTAMRQHRKKRTKTNKRNNKKQGKMDQLMLFYTQT
jgi:uncharacterized protein YxeA